MGKWKFFKEINFNDKLVTIFHIDTRDFHCYPQYDVDTSGLNISKISKYPYRFFHSKEEIVELLNRYFEDSGGNKKWRMFTLMGKGKEHSDNWQLKYLRIHQTEYGFVICDKDNKALNKDILEYSVCGLDCHSS